MLVLDPSNLGVIIVNIRDLPIILEILPIMLCCTAQNFAHYAQIMLNIYSSIPMLC